MGETEATRRANKLSMVTTADENLWFAERRAAVSSLLAQEATALSKVREYTVITLCRPTVGNKPRGTSQRFPCFGRRGYVDSRSEYHSSE